MKRKVLKPREVWKWVVGYKGYYKVSNLGRVRSMRRNIVRSNGKPMAIPGRLLKQGKDKGGYKMVDLNKNGKGIKRMVHRLVLETFHGPMPNGMQCCHNNGDKNDNRLTNLRYGTPKENTIDIIKHRMEQGKKDKRLKITDKQVLKIRNEYRPNVTGYGKLAKKYGVNKSTIIDIVKKRTRKNIGNNGEFVFC